MLPTLYTSRLMLRPCGTADVDALHALWCEPAVRRHLWDDRIITREEASETVDALLAAADGSAGGLWMVQEDDGAAPVGFAALRAIEGTPEIELIYGLAPTVWGRGLATEASRAVLTYGFEALRLPRIWGRTDPPNTESLRVLARLGMRAAENPGRDPQPIVSFVLDRPA